MWRLFLMRCALGNKQSTAVGEARIFCFCFSFPVIAVISTIIIRREEREKKKHIQSNLRPNAKEWKRHICFLK